MKSNSPVDCWASPVSTAMHPYEMPLGIEETSLVTRSKDHTKVWSFQRVKKVQCHSEGAQRPWESVSKNIGHLTPFCVDM